MMPIIDSSQVKFDSTPSGVVPTANVKFDDGAAPDEARPSLLTRAGRTMANVGYETLANAAKLPFAAAPILPDAVKQGLVDTVDWAEQKQADNASPAPQGLAEHATDIVAGVAPFLLGGEVAGPLAIINNAVTGGTDRAVRAGESLPVAVASGMASGATNAYMLKLPMGNFKEAASAVVKLPVAGAAGAVAQNAITTKPELHQDPLDPTARLSDLAMGLGFSGLAHFNTVRGSNKLVDSVAKRIDAGEPVTHEEFQQVQKIAQGGMGDKAQVAAQDIAGNVTHPREAVADALLAKATGDERPATEILTETPPAAPETAPVEAGPTIETDPEGVVDKFLSPEPPQAAFPEQADVHADTLSKALEAGGVAPDSPLHTDLVGERRQRERAPDAVTGLIAPGHHYPTLDRAWQEHADAKRDFSYGVVDVVNMGGLNTWAGGEASANPHIREMAQIINTQVKADHPSAQVFRRGGDEFAVIAPDVSAKDLNASLDKARKAVTVYAQENGFADAPHKTAGKPAGVGIEHAASDFKDHTSVAAVEKATDSQLALIRKQKGESHVNASTTGEVGTVAPEGQTAGAAGRTGGDGEANPATVPLAEVVVPPGVTKSHYLAGVKEAREAVAADPQAAAQRFKEMSAELGDPGPDSTLTRKEAAQLRAWGDTLGQPVVKFSQSKPFFSKVQELVEKKMGGSAPLDQLKTMLKNNGASPAEIEQTLSGLDKGKVTKQEVLDTLKANATELKDVVLGEKVGREYKVEPNAEETAYTGHEMVDVVDPITGYTRFTGRPEEAQDWITTDHSVTATETPTQFETYQEPGAKEGSYREMFVTAPETNKSGVLPKEALGQFMADNEMFGGLKDGFYLVDHQGDALDSFNTRAELEEFVKSEVSSPTEYVTLQAKNGKVVLAEDRSKTWSDGHSQYGDIQNPVVRIRFNEREADGKRILFVEEMQGPSDANQTKMPEYLRKRIYDLGVKRVLAYAKENGFDGVAWTPGKIQADRYSLEKDVDHIKWVADVSNGEVDISRKFVTVVMKEAGSVERMAVSADGTVSSDKPPLDGKNISDVVGKELGKKILSADDGRISGEGLKVGGEGLKRLYDQTLPSLFKKYGKEGVGEVQLKAKDQGIEGEYYPPPLDGESFADTMARAKSDNAGLATFPHLPISAKTPESYPLFSKGNDSTPTDSKGVPADPYTQRSLDAALSKYYDGKPPEKARFVLSDKTVDPTIARLAELYGRDVVLFDAVGGKGPNAFYTGTEQLFLNAGAKDMHLQLFGHELTHDLKQNAPDLFDLLEQVALANGMDKGLHESAREETLADYVGNKLTQKQFLDRIANHDHGLLARVIAAVRLFAIQVRQLVSEGSVVLKDSERMETAAAEALARYMKRKDLSEAQVMAEGSVEFSRDQMEQKLKETLDVKPVRAAISGLGAMTKGIDRIVLPGKLSGDAAKAVGIVRQQIGETNREQAMLTKRLDSSVPKVKATGIARLKDMALQSGRTLADSVFAKLPEKTQHDFMQTLDTGKAPDGFIMTPELKSIGEVLTKTFSDLATQVQSLGTGALDTVRETYFPHIYTQESRLALNQALEEAYTGGLKDAPATLTEWTPEQKGWLRSRVAELAAKGEGKENDYWHLLSKRPVEGSKAFTKGRTFDDVQSALDVGLQLVSSNPIDLAYLKFNEMRKYISVHTAVQEMETTIPESVKVLPNTAERPRGYSELLGPYGSVKRDVAGTMVPHKYFLRDDVAQVYNNYLSQSLYANKYVGPMYSTWMKAANVLNQWQLGLGAFHLGFTTGETIISHGALGFKALSRGDFKEGLTKLVTAPTAVKGSWRMGQALMDAYRDPTAVGAFSDILLKMGLSKDDVARMTSPETGIAAMIEQAGGAAHMDRRFQTNAMQKAIEAYSKGDKLGTALHAPGALVETAARPIMEWLVPRQKFGVFGEMAIDWMRRNPDATHDEIRAEAQQIWNRIDSRLGQVVYDRLFVHNVAKNVAQMLVRAPGWTGGTFLELGGGMLDLGKWAGKIATTGKVAELTDRAAYTVSLATGMALANGLLTALFTGEMPDEKDIWAFRTGGLDEQGRPERFLMPTYWKDVHSWLTEPEKTATNKLHPLLGLAKDVNANKDFYGTEIRHQDDNWAEQAAELLGFGVKAFTPFWMRGVAKEVDRGQDNPLSYAGPLVGIMPAPATFNMSKAERVMYDIVSTERGEAPKTQAQFDKSQLVNKIAGEQRRGEDSGALQEALAAGKLAPADLKRIRDKVSMEPLIRNFGHLNLNDALHVYDLGDEVERDKLEALLHRKMNAGRQNMPPADYAEVKERWGKYFR